ncbi:MAG: arabinose ABC transporter substrate-binding protein [Planctomycetota bacterium]|nr:arabinose ABC transporter substrate-binding protein [Planctomycetota bacterium]
MRFLTLSCVALLTACVVGCGGKPDQSAASPAKIKIGFVVKNPEQEWFQNEHKFAQQAADKDGFDLLFIGAPTDELVKSAIDTLGAQGAQGMIICTPDVRLGTMIMNQANRYNMKVFSVDDQFVNGDGKYMDEHHMGISAEEIGKSVGNALSDEMKKRGWKVEETGACVASLDELDTARQRMTGVTEALTAAGFPAERIFKSHQASPDFAGGRDAANIVLTQHSDIKHWLTAGMNDETVLGEVRAMENRGFNTDTIIGIGIGADAGRADFEKPQPTGFFASVLISPKRHGYETADYMYHWIKDGAEPPKVTYTTGILVHRDDYKTVRQQQGLD